MTDRVALVLKRLNDPGYADDGDVTMANHGNQVAVAVAVARRPPITRLPNAVLSNVMRFLSFPFLVGNVSVVSRWFYRVAMSKASCPPEVDLCEYKFWIDDNFVSRFVQCKYLLRLALDGATIGPAGFEAILTCGALRSLKLTNCAFLNDSKVNLADLSKLPALVTLDLSRNRWFTDEHIKGLGGLTLHKLKLVKCVLLTDAGIVTLCKTLCSLKALDISHCPLLTSASVGMLQHLTQLREVAVSRGERKQDYLALTSACDLFTFRCYQATLEPRALHAFAGTKLINFELYHCQGVTDADLLHALAPSGHPDHLKQHSLRRLVVSHCPGITGTKLQFLSALPHLECLLMHHCDNLQHLGFLRQGLPRLRLFDVTCCSRIAPNQWSSLSWLPQHTRVAVSTSENADFNNKIKAMAQTYHLRLEHQSFK